MEVLIVDDEKDIVDGIRRNLELEGHEVTGASDEEEAIKAIEEQPFDVILLDIKFPQVTGVDLLKKFKEIRPLANVVMITGYSSMENIIECMKAGAVDYFTKPLDMDEITRRMEQIEEKVDRWADTVGIEELT
jgi:DNA-binding NtrC family response regulator